MCVSENIFNWIWIFNLFEQTNLLTFSYKRLHAEVHVCVHIFLSQLPVVLPRTGCSLWGPVRWSTEHICPPQTEAETPADSSVHPLLTNPVIKWTHINIFQQYTITNPTSRDIPHYKRLYGDTYIFQVRQYGCAQEESKVYLRSPGQAHCCSLVYDLCCCLVLVVCVNNRCKSIQSDLTFFFIYTSNLNLYRRIFVYFTVPVVIFCKLLHSLESDGFICWLCPL